MITLFATAQSCVVLAVILAIFVCAPHVPCGAQTYIVFLHKFSATGGGRTVGIVGTAILLVGHTGFVSLEYAQVALFVAKTRAHDAELPNATAGAPPAVEAASPGLPTIAQQASAPQTNTALLPPGLEPDMRSPGFSVAAPPGLPTIARQASASQTNTALLPPGLEPDMRSPGFSVAAPPGLPTIARQASASQTNTALLPPELELDVRSPGFSVDRPISGRLLKKIVAIVLVTALAVANTELLRHWNGAPASGGQWGFGQFLALAVAAVPGWQTVRVFYEHGLGFVKPKKRLRVHPKN
jgi:hypothetical protein